MKIIEKEFAEYVLQITSKFKLDTKISWTQSFHANENNTEAINYVRKASSQLNLNILEKELPFTFGEDFGIFTQHFKGAMFGIGSGKNTPSLHNPDYDFPDELIPTGTQLFHQIIKEVTNA